MLRPGDWAIARIEILDCLANRNRSIAELETALEVEMRERKMRLRSQLRIDGRDLVGHNRAFAVRRQAGGALLFRRPAENVQAKIVTHDGREQLVVIVGRVVRAADIELVVAVLTAAMADQEQEERVAGLQLLLDSGESFLDFSLRGLLVG